jgi:sigma-B regulation protein RsbU (phosphoserine phosphatase)
VEIDKANINWESELDKTAYKYHYIVLWVALILNPVWAIGDYFTIPVHFVDFFVFRMTVSVACVITLIYREKFIDKPWVLAFIPFLGIAIQNGFMYSVMNVVELEKHTFAFIALFIGAGMFVLWKRIYSIIIVLLTIVFSIIFFIAWSPLQLGEILINGGMLTATVSIFTIVLIQTRTSLTKKEIISRLALEESYKELAHKNFIIEENNKDIRDSINYAKRIQQAILPRIEHIDTVLPNFFIHFQPKDIVSGDFYWQAQVKTSPLDGSPGENIVVVAAVDCTGHGVPGALMSIIGSTILNQTITSSAVNSPGEALDYLNKELNNSLKDIRDGMDMSLVAINFKKMILQYAGANNPIYIFRNKVLTELKPDKQAIGNDADHKHDKKFTNQIFNLEKNDTIYLFTDGYADQFGGPKGKKFGYRNFQSLLLEISELPMSEQKTRIQQAHLDWRGKLDQVDDICIIGIKI